MKNILKNKQANNVRNYMTVNVILTFETFDSFGETQTIFDLQLPISKVEKSAEDFLNKKLFKRITNKCKTLKRSVKDLSKISIAGNWDTFEKITNKFSLHKLGHSCKWHFGNGRNDLDSWELDLISKFKFGINADMSWVGNPQLTQQYFNYQSKKYLNYLNKQYKLSNQSK